MVRIETILWKQPIDILTVGDTLAYDGAILFVYGNTDSETADPNFVLIGISGHPLNIP